MHGSRPFTKVVPYCLDLDFISLAGGIDTAHHFEVGPTNITQGENVLNNITQLMKFNF